MGWSFVRFDASFLAWDPNGAGTSKIARDPRGSIEILERFRLNPSIVNRSSQVAKCSDSSAMAAVMR